MRVLKILLVGAFLLASTAAHAGLISVFSDVNIFNPVLPADNDQVALNMMGGGTNSLISSQTGGVDADGLNTFYNAQGGITNTRTGAGLTAGLLTGIDLLVLDIGFGRLSPYDAGELTVITNFLAGSGDEGLPR